jgi:hypothetical protein
VAKKKLKDLPDKTVIYFGHLEKMTLKELKEELDIEE